MTANRKDMTMTTTHDTDARSRVAAAQDDADRARAAAERAQREADAAAAAFTQLVSDAGTQQVSAKKLSDAKAAAEGARIKAEAMAGAAEGAAAAARTARLGVIAEGLAQQSGNVDRAVELMHTIEDAVRELIDIEATRDTAVTEALRALRSEGVHRVRHGQPPREEDAGLAWADLTSIGIAGQEIHYQGRKIKTITKGASSVLALALDRATDGHRHKLKPHVSVTGQTVRHNDDVRGWVAYRLGL
jgi:hypothetical protein